MLIKQITGKTEELAIIVSKSCQVIGITKTEAAPNEFDFKDEQIEVSLVDFSTGKEEYLLRKQRVKFYAEIVAQGGNLRRCLSALIEVSDGRNLYLDANRVLRINLTGLTAADTYKVITFESDTTGGIPVKLEQLVVAAGVTNQKFPITNGSLLVLPKTDLLDIRAVYNDSTEVRLSAEELLERAKAMNGIISVREDNHTFKLGADELFLYDLELDNKRVVEFEVNTQAAGGFTMYKAIGLHKPGFENTI